MAFGAVASGIGLAEDLRRGIIDRFRSLPMARSAVLVGRICSDTVRLAMVAVVLVLVGYVVGFRFAGSDGAIRYGWLRISVGQSLTGSDRRVVEYAFESTPGAPIVAVPAPGAIALLAVSGASVFGRRRRAA